MNGSGCGGRMRIRSVGPSHRHPGVGGCDRHEIEGEVLSSTRMMSRAYAWHMNVDDRDSSRRPP